MQPTQTLLFEQTDGILLITINREQALNALSMQTLADLKSTFEQIAKDSSIKGIIITGAGEKAFVAGADIKEFTQINESNAFGMSENGQQVFAMIENCTRPVIAAVNGYALGGGCELAIACHMRLASANAKFAQPEINLGIIPGYGGTQRLTDLIGKGKAMELILTGNMIDAEEAKLLNLVNYVLSDKDSLLEKCREILHTISQKAPVAVGMAIKSINAKNSYGENGYQVEAKNFSKCCITEDFKEGIDAFVNKRQPIFKGK